MNLDPLDKKIKELNQRCSELCARSIVSIGTTRNVNNKELFFSAPRIAPGHVCLNVLVQTAASFSEILSFTDGRVDQILIDVERKTAEIPDPIATAREKVTTSSLRFFRSNHITAAAFEAVAIPHLFRRSGRSLNLSCLIVGSGNLGSKVAQILNDYGIAVTLFRRTSSRASAIRESIEVLRAPYNKTPIFSLEDLSQAGDYDAIIGASDGVPVILESTLGHLKPGGIIFDLGLGTLSSEAINLCRERAIEALCVIAYPGFSGLLQTLSDAEALLGSIGAKTQDQFSMISGGIIGKYGDFIVDNIHQPKRLLGLSKGNGLVLNEEEKKILEPSIRSFESTILRGT